MCERGVFVCEVHACEVCVHHRGRVCAHVCGGCVATWGCASDTREPQGLPSHRYKPLIFRSFAYGFFFLYNLD